MSFFEGCTTIQRSSQRQRGNYEFNQTAKWIEAQSMSNNSQTYREEDEED